LLSSPWIEALQATPEWEAVQTALQNEEDIHPSTAALKALCADLNWAGKQEEQLAEALKALPSDNVFAVHSSSPEEDLAGAFSAGGYETFLGITEATLLEAAQGCLASAFDARVFIYKQQHGFQVEQPRITVIVQQQIASEIAGVGFTLNAINNDYDEAVIDANWGQGESVVSGMVVVDIYVVNKVTRTIVEKKLGGKEVAVWLTLDGGSEERPGERTDQFCLTDAQAIEVGDLLVQVEELYQQPTDIEWAIAYGTLCMLQARPITTHFPLPAEMITEPVELRLHFQEHRMFHPGTSDSLRLSPPNAHGSIRQLAAQRWREARHC
jgi:pyruvate,water dikinase